MDSNSNTDHDKLREKDREKRKNIYIKTSYTEDEFVPRTEESQVYGQLLAFYTPPDNKDSLRDVKFRTIDGSGGCKDPERHI